MWGKIKNSIMNPGLKPKFLVYIISAIIVMGSLFSWHHAHESKKILAWELERKGEAVARNLAYNSKYGVMTKNEDILKQLLAGIFQEADVNSAVIYDAGGKVLVKDHKGRRQIPVLKPLEIEKINFANEQHYEDYTKNGIFPLLRILFAIRTSKTLETDSQWDSEDRLLELETDYERVPFPEEANNIIGYVQINMSLEKLTSEKTRVIRTDIFITLLIVSIMVIFSFIFAGRVTKPIQAMASTAALIAQGDLSLRVSKYAPDEIGVLGDCFNQMVDSLERRNSEIQQLNQGLEQKVRKRTQELEIASALMREERDRAQSYFDTAGVMLVVINTDQTVSLINKKGCEILGYGGSHVCCADIVGKNWFDNFIPEKIRDEVSLVFEKLINEEIEVVEYYENPVLTKDGQERLISWHNIVLRDEKKKIIGTLSSGEDVTEHKQAEEALRESEEKLRSVFDNMQDVFYRADSEGRVVWVSPSAVEMLGYESTDELIGRNLAQEFYETPGKRKIFLEELLQKGRVSDYVVELRKRDGSTIVVSTNSHYCKNERGEIIGVEGSCRDITKRWQAEEALRQSEKRFRDVVMSISDWVWEIDTDARYTYCSERVSDVLGYAAKELLGCTPFKLMPPQEASRVRKIFKELSKDQGAIVDLENWNISKKGRKVCLLTNGVPMYDREGTCIGYRGVDKDITERKQAEEALKRAHEELEVRVKERTAELAGANQELQVKIRERKQAQEALQRKNRLQKVLNAMLRISMKADSLAEILDRVLDRIFSIPWLAVESQGAVFLVEDNPAELVLKSWRELPVELQTVCGRIPFGKCLCGQAALTKELQFADSIGEQHEYQYKGLSPHGHYCVPILSSGKTLGVLVLYVKAGHQRDKEEEDFLLAIANVLAGIIERKRAEEALRESEERYRCLVENIDLGITMVDANYNILMTNTGQGKMFHKPISELVGRKCFLEFEKRKAICAHCPGAKAMLSHSAQVVETEGVRDDGSRFLALVRAFPTFGADDAATGFIEVVEDITERKRAEEVLKTRQREIEELNASLEQRVQEEVEKSRQKDLIMMHQSRLAAMGEMIGLIAHQWRQPLNALNILLYNIKDLYDHKQLSQQMLDDLTSTGVNLAMKMSSTIDDFRNFFRPYKAEEKFSVNQIVRDSLSLVDASFKYHNISVTVNESQKLTVNGSPSEYSQVILNVLNNARDAIVANKIDGEVAVNIFQHDGLAVVKIGDNGGGIPTDVFNRIFEPYFTVKEPGEGTGLGLYLSKVIIEEHMEGHIVVQNAHGGAEFSITTPMASASDIP